MPSRNVTAEDFDPRERFALYRLCDCPTCDGRGQVPDEAWLGGVGKVRTRCPDCRGEGRIRQEVATCESPEAVGVALVTLAREGEFAECQFGLLDRGGAVNAKWLVLPYPQTARTLTAAARLMAKARK